MLGNFFYSVTGETPAFHKGLGFLETFSSTREHLPLEIDQT